MLCAAHPRRARTRLMKYLVSLPESTVAPFHALAGVSPEHWFAASDPKGSRVGSGGGSAWLLSECWRTSQPGVPFSRWLGEEGRILIHGGGKCRRLPAYAAVGKLLLPVPVFRWQRGQRLNQTLLDLQRPLLEKVIAAAGEQAHTLIASGDALVLSDEAVPPLADVDVLCFGLSVDPSLASRHGVFVCPRREPTRLTQMLQKPSTDTLRSLAIDSLFLIDVGIWLLSDRAVELIMRRSGWDPETERYAAGIPSSYDLYGTFGLGLGSRPCAGDPEINALSTAILEVPGGEFYHFGTTRELVSSSWAIQNKVRDQKAIWTKNIKPHPSIFTQNAEVETVLTGAHRNLWVENSHVASGWKLEGDQVITGVFRNDWKLRLPKGLCLDVAPVGESRFALRPYGIDDSFRGTLAEPTTRWMNQPFSKWLSARGLTLQGAGLRGDSDLHQAPIFPIVDLEAGIEAFIAWLLEGRGDGAKRWVSCERLSAEELALRTHLERLHRQQTGYRSRIWPCLANNSARSVFFQIDLDHAAREFASHDLPLPPPLSPGDDPLHRAHDLMFRSRVERYQGRSGKELGEAAFAALREAILAPLSANRVQPRSDVHEDQIVWARSPVRIDLAGGWTDTPPQSVLAGGAVVNLSLELNGQPPLQAFVRPTRDRKISLRSIDLGESELIDSYEALELCSKVGSAFAIPRAALYLAGFHPSTCLERYPDLPTQLDRFGSGLEIAFLAAVPKGSGMGTSSILAATLLGALSDFAGLGWDSFEIGSRTLALEQLLTTGGGWQDQYGGILPGVKLLQTERGWQQAPRIRWLPERLFTAPEYRAASLLYYTGLTRVAKELLSEIVEGMFLNERDRVAILSEMKLHALETFEVIQRCDYAAYGSKIRRTWELNKRLDRATTNPDIEGILRQVDDLALGYKLPGAGGGGFLYIVGKDPEAARRIRQRLEQNPPNARARFVEMKLSEQGLQVSRS